ncbi:helix-turn-helix transcriptional regulator [Candidatus Woesearchaeota archaeon]|nr:helix-turn-helix transcriptional regulator [Candidatus Woesearchaeota archaeon]
MASRNFLLVSLEESKAKQLAQIVSNDVCRRILDYLAAKEKHATETEVAKDLGMPLSTVHYNLKQLLQSGIVKTEEFHYSEKGREVLHYSLANKYIIIAPKASATESLANKLRKILPVVGVVAATGIAIQLFSTLQQGAIGRSFAASYSAQRTLEQGVVQKAAEAVVPQAATAASAVTEKVANETAAPAIREVVVQTVQQPANIALWFAIGALFALVVYLIYDVVRERRQK